MRAGGVNVATAGTASQSSTSSGGVASRGIDGNTSGHWPDGSVTHTANQTAPWWEVDLGATYDIDEIWIWNRTDCCSERLDGYTLQVLDGVRMVEGGG